MSINPVGLIQGIVQRAQKESDQVIKYENFMGELTLAGIPIISGSVE
jgi:hypothetical protein